MEDMLRACVLEFKDSLVVHLSLVKFAYNSYQASIGMAPYEALYGRKCQTPLCWDEVSERKLDDVELIETTSKRLRLSEKAKGGTRSTKELCRYSEKGFGI